MFSFLLQRNMANFRQLFFNKRSRMVQGVEEQKASVSAGQKVIEHDSK
jgi:hypothetical protein